MKDSKAALAQALKTSRTIVHTAYFSLAVAVVSMAINIGFGLEYEWVTIPFGIIATLGFICFAFLIKSDSLMKKRYTYLSKKGICGTKEIQVTDKFTYIRMLMGDEGRLENHFHLVDPEGHWRLDYSVEQRYAEIPVGSKLRISYASSDRYKEVFDLEILETGQSAEPIKKYMSEVEITGVNEEGSLKVNKFHLAKQVRCYHVVNGQAEEVDRNVFVQTTLPVFNRS